MVHYNQYKKTVSSLKTSIYQVELEEDPLYITYGILDQICKVLDEEDISAKEIILCLATLYKNVIANIVKKPHNLWKKPLKTTFKNPNVLKKLHPDFSEEGKEKMLAEYVGVFCQNLGITTYTLENYSNFKNKFLYNNGSILEINDYHNNRSRGNVSLLSYLT